MKDLKTLLYIAILYIFASACTKNIDFHRDNIKPLLMMNAQMTAGDSLHLVYLAISKDLSIERISSGSVRCFVNGKFVAEAAQDNRNDEIFITDEETDVYGFNAGDTRQTRFSFKADFKPGDIVRIEAEADGGVYKASSEVTVPKAPAIDTPDTVRQAVPGLQYVHQYKIRVKGKDIAGEDNYFRIKAGYSATETIYVKATGYEEAKMVTRPVAFKYLSIDKGNDAILKDGAPADDLDLSGAASNSFNVFSDAMFADGTFNIGFTVEDFVSSSAPYISSDVERIDSEITLHVIVSGLTADEYHYLKALSIYDYLDGDTTLTEPVSFPNNVEGGVGLVSVCTPAVATVKFHRTYTDGGIYAD